MNNQEKLMIHTYKLNENEGKLCRNERVKWKKKIKDCGELYERVIWESVISIFLEKIWVI